MLIVFNGCTMATPGATGRGLYALVTTMQHAIEKWHREGKPLSNQG